MDIPLARKIGGIKYMWDGGTYESEDQARQVMADYAKEGFAVELIAMNGKYLVYSRRVVEAQS